MLWPVMLVKSVNTLDKYKVEHIFVVFLLAAWELRCMVPGIIDTVFKMTDEIPRGTPRVK